jgi:hypothetical protein
MLHVPSSLPVEVLPGWPVGADPAGLHGNPTLALEVHLDAVAAVVLDELSYRRAAWLG